ncbi:MAG: PorT family protein [Bacteroidales bacterium]|nr:PorT family protein [Bacteroidales bacterium]MDD2322635.1 outer membrane beta-barrel protein [Bacteroidales bacterium]MDD3962213.1 outer membrane beta-barrel protein [Bacteroidales bacterium]MDY0286033.1 outer membrane beta-barrel protein [Bacteroidales bacterium]
MRSKYLLTFFFIFLLAVLGQSLYAQKMTPKTQRRAKAATRQVLMNFKEDLNHIYREDNDGTPRLKTEFASQAARHFYYPNDATDRHIHRSFIDTKDTLLRDVPEMMNIHAFTDTLISWYCNPDSCELGVIFDFTDITIDTLDYYIDPEIIAVNLFFDVDMYGDLFAPHMEKYRTKKEEKAGKETEEEAIFFVEEYASDWQTLQPDAAMATFIITRDGDNFSSVKIYKIYRFDPFNNDLPDLRTIIRPVIASRNKTYISLMGGMGYSQALAKFESNTSFESLSDFRPGFNGDVSFDYFFNDGPRKFTYGYSAGIGYSRYNASVSIASFSQSFPSYSEALAKDYIMNLYATEISQDLSLNYIDIPVSFKLKYKSKNYLNFYIDAGMAFSYLFSPGLSPAGKGSLTYTGTFSYDFPQGTQQVTYENVPYYGFTTFNTLQYSEEDPGFRSFNLSALVNAGTMFWLSQRLSANVELMYRYGFINLVDKSADSMFILSEGEGRVNNIFRNCNFLHTNAFMINVGVSYFLKSNK